MKKKVLFIASECVPFVKTGGLADVVGSLPRYFNQDNYEVRVIVPNYLCIAPAWKEKMNFVTSFYIKNFNLFLNNFSLSAYLLIG